MFEIAPTTKILILSGSSDTCFNLVILLKKTGLTKITCISNASQALEFCAAKPVNLILCDQHLSGLPGWAFIKEFKISAHLRNAGVIFFGDAPCPVSPAELHHYGVLGYLTAPLQLKPLMELVAGSLSELERQGSTEKAYSAAKASLVDGHTADAVSHYKNLVTTTDKSVRSSLGLAYAFEKAEDHVEAARVLDDLPPSDEVNVPLLVIRARLALRQGDLTAGEHLLRSLLQLTPDAEFYVRLYAELGFKHELLGFAEEACQLAIAKGFTHAAFSIILAKCLVKKGDIDGAYKLLKRLDDEGSMTLEALKLLGVCLGKLGKHKAAVACYQKGLELAPKDEKIYFNLALCDIALGDLEAAKKMLEKAITLAPMYVKAQDKLTEVRDLLRHHTVA